MPRLTKKFVDGLKSDSQDVFVWESEIRGSGVRLKPFGTKTFFVQYRNKSNRTRRLVIGQFGILTVELARALARERLVEVIKGEDPSTERKAARNAYTVKNLCNWYLLEAESGRLLSRKRRPINAFPRLDCTRWSTIASSPFFLRSMLSSISLFVSWMTIFRLATAAVNSG